MAGKFLDLSLDSFLIFLSCSYAERLCCWCRRASLSGAKRKAEGSSPEGSSDVALLTSPRASPAKSRAHREEEKKKEEEEEASNRV